jgi:hypothetical protein
MSLMKVFAGGPVNAPPHTLHPRQSRKAAKVSQSQRQRCTSVSALKAQAATTLLLCRTTTRLPTASAGDEVYQTSTLKSGHDGTTVKRIDTGRLLDETIITQAAEMMVARGNAKMIGIDPTTAWVTMVGLVAAVGGWAMTMLVARTILPSNTRAVAL